MRRADYVEVDPRFGHDLTFPYVTVQHGKRAVYDADATRLGPPARDLEDEYGRKVRMFEHCWLILAPGRDAPRGGPALSLRALRAPRPSLRERAPPRRSCSGPASPSSGSGLVYELVLAAQVALLVLAPRAACGSRFPARPIAYYYVLVTWATVAALFRYVALRRAARLGEGRGHTVKRAVDVVGAGVGLALASPLIGLAALAIKLDDGGPVFYRQRRVGLNGEEFDLVKLRTMIPGAEAQGAGWAVDYADPRITRVGRVLRRLSVDELPQLWNVLHGEMSLVGPRPTLAYQVEQYTARQRRRLDVKPGLTGWAQVNGRAKLLWTDRIELDLWYVENRSAWLDLKIIARTPRVLFSGTYRGDTGGWRQR